jgi:CDP-glycerol glycerophosphotransferase (TagB/SpsB family)
MGGYAPPQYMVGQEKIFDDDAKYLIVVESPLDAMLLRGVGVRANVLTKSQVKLLKMSRRTIVMVPDYNREEAAGFINVARENGWYLSAPFSKDLRFKDIGDVIKYGGVLFSIQKILSSKTKRLVLI